MLQGKKIVSCTWEVAGKTAPEPLVEQARKLLGAVPQTCVDSETDFIICEDGVERAICEAKVATSGEPNATLITPSRLMDMLSKAANSTKSGKPGARPTDILKLEDHHVALSGDFYSQGYTAKQLIEELKAVGAIIDDAISTTTQFVVYTSEVSRIIADCKARTHGPRAKLISEAQLVASLQALKPAESGTAHKVMINEKPPSKEEEDDEGGDDTWGDDEEGEGDEGWVVDNKAMLEQYVAALEEDTADGTHWYNVGLALAQVSEVEGITFDGVEYNEVDSYVRAVECDPSISDAWYNLGRSMDSSVSVRVGGKATSRVDCFAKAAETTRTTDGHCWCNLGDALLNEGGVDAQVEVGGVKYTALTAALKALKMDTTNAIAWNNVAEVLLAKSTPTPTRKRGRDADASTAVAPCTVTALGQEYTAQQCLVKALSFDDTIPDVWLHLKRTLTTESPSVKVGKRTYTGEKIDALVKELQEDNSDDDDEDCALGGITCTL